MLENGKETWDKTMVNPAPYTLVGNLSPSYRGSDAEEPSGAMDVPSQQTESVILAQEEESVPGASVTTSTSEGAPCRLQHLVATRDLGMWLVASLEVGQLQPDWRGLCSYMALSTTFNMEGKKQPWPCTFLLPTILIHSF